MIDSNEREEEKYVKATSKSRCTKEIIGHNSGTKYELLSKIVYFLKGLDKEIETDV